ncbi:MAG: NADH-quinone oxidoreductase subunit NuoH [Phycisphaerae bacterium]|nr:NADH-quinone oxidoreductase subunit NuoH [Phycisphaerae bacterium]MBT5382061.1 NADH-quinone oxidoreductase subunit NuoH [Phycisphaerae bacterium]MBT5582455.1 NADH-quinone oxidoreductase subunit NuoH [Phycisphaerae bacterium]
MSDWLSAWLLELPPWLPQVIVSLIVIVVVLHMCLGAAAYLILLERKVCAWAQDRIGPSRVGPLGLLQPLADGLKLFFKEEFMPQGVDRVLFMIAPALTVIPAMIGFVVIPWGGYLEFGDGHQVAIMGADINIGVVYLVAAASLGVYGVGLGGWASNNKYSFLGGLRATAQMISYEIPMGLALLCVVLTAGTLLPQQIVGQQLAGQWYLIQQPIVAIIFYICLLAEAGRAPFDLAEAEQELIGGWHTEYSSMKWALFFMGEYIHLVVGSAFFVTLFLGGWSLNPITGWDLPQSGGILLILLQFGIVLGKVFILVFLTMMVRWTLPRFRFDQLMKLAWEGLIPLSLLLLLMTSVFVYLGWRPWLWAGSLGCMGLIWLILPLMPGQASSNHKIGLVGSRFSPPTGR